MARVTSRARGRWRAPARLRWRVEDVAPRELGDSRHHFALPVHRLRLHVSLDKNIPRECAILARDRDADRPGRAHRFRIVEVRAGPLPVGTIGDRPGLRQPQVSKHLRVLGDVGLVDVQPQAQQYFMTLCPAPSMSRMQVWLEGYRQPWTSCFWINWMTCSRA